MSLELWSLGVEFYIDLDGNKYKVTFFVYQNSKAMEVIEFIIPSFKDLYWNLHYKVSNV